MARGEPIAVVGAGIVGCAVAFELARGGAEVTVYDGRRIAGGATQASAGILAPYTEAHEGGALFDLTVRGLHVYDTFVERVRGTSRCPFEYRRAGTLEIAEDAARASELQGRLTETWASAVGLEWLDAGSLRAAAPCVAPTAVGALRCATHGHVAVPAFTTAIADAARILGARTELGAPVTRIELSARDVVVHTASDAAVYSRVVLCSGAWTPSIDPTGRTRDRIRPVRGQLVRLFSPEADVRTVLWGRSCYIVPWEDGTLLVGATSEEVGFDDRPTAEGVRQLLAAAEALVPCLESAVFLDVLVGLRPASTCGLPVLGPSSDPRVLHAAGHFRNGILLAPLTAELLANYVFRGARDPAFSVT